MIRHIRVGLGISNQSDAIFIEVFKKEEIQSHGLLSSYLSSLFLLKSTDK